MSIFQRIDQALGSVAGVESGLPDYANMLARLGRSRLKPGERLAALRAGVVDIAAEHYLATLGRRVELFEFNDGAFDYLFDATLERSVLAHGLSRSTPPNSRDAAYHKGYPRREGYEKGHAMAHAQGGREGGPNYFPQRAALNRRLSGRGQLWRDIETWLAANPGAYAFVRMIYAPGANTDVPMKLEYGLLNHARQFRAVIFSNR